MAFLRIGRARFARFGRPRKLAVSLIAFALVLAVIAIGSLLLERKGHLTNLDPIPSGATVDVRPFSHVYLIVFENKSENDVVGSTEAPYLAELMSRYGTAMDYQAVAHPSQPNYLALFSGSTHDVDDDSPHDLTAPNLADELESAGRTWRVQAEDYPAHGCFTGPTASGGLDGDGLYVRKHDPAISFVSISRSPARCANIQPLSTFDAAAADFTLIVPNMCHDMHDCPVATGDTWLRRFLPRILDSTSWRDGGVLFITFDEAAQHSRPNVVPTFVVASDVPAGFRSEVAHTHYSLLHTIQAGLGLPCLAESCAANTMGEFFPG